MAFISNQARVVLMMQLVQIAIVVIAVLMAPLSPLAKTSGVLSTIVFMGIGAWLLFKSINCMVVGDCTSFAWIIVGVMLFFFTTAVIGSIVGSATMKNNPTQWVGGVLGGKPPVAPPATAAPAKTDATTTTPKTATATATATKATSA